MKPSYKAKAGGRREERLHKGDARSRLCPHESHFFQFKDTTEGRRGRLPAPTSCWPLRAHSSQALSALGSDFSVCATGRICHFLIYGKECCEIHFSRPADFVICSALRRVRMNASFSPTGLPCNMLLMTGMPRSGSTWQSAMVRSALQQLRVKVAVSGYWDMAQHVGMKPADAKRYYLREHERWRKIRPGAVLVYKSHEFRKSATAICENTTAITMRRCPEDIMRSFVRAGWLGSSPEPRAIASTMRLYLRYHAEWLAFGALDMSYEWAVRNPKAMMDRIVGFLAARLGLSPRHVERTLGKEGARVTRSLLAEANRAIPSSSRSSNISRMHRTALAQATALLANEANWHALLRAACPAGGRPT